MKRNGWLILVLGLGLAGLAPAALAADPVEGYWKSIDEKTDEVTAIWKIYTKGDTLYGEIVRVPGKPADELATKARKSYKNFPVAGVVNQMKVVGTPWIFGLTSKKEGSWSGGNIVDPGKGDIYECKITFRAANGKKYQVDTLEMRGEIGLGIGRSQFWVKATPADINGN